MIRIRPECLLVAIGVGIFVSWEDAAYFSLAVVIHEMGHGLVGRLRGAQRWLDLQLGAGDAYTGDRRDVWVLLAGPATSGAAAVAAQVLGATAGARWLWIWTLFQLFPLPASDAGVLMRGLLTGPLRSERWAFVAVLVLGLLAGGWGLIRLGPEAVFLVWGLGLGVLLSATEWPAVVHQEAFRLYEEGRYREAASLATSGPSKRARSLRRLGVAAALAADDFDKVARLLYDLPASDPSTWAALRRLLESGHPEGRRLGERVVDRVSGQEDEFSLRAQKDLADIFATFASTEAARGAEESALGLLEQAGSLGFDRFDWLEYRSEFDGLRDHPRYRRLVDAGPA